MNRIQRIELGCIEEEEEIREQSIRSVMIFWCRAVPLFKSILKCRIHEDRENVDRSVSRNGGIDGEAVGSSACFCERRRTLSLRGDPQSQQHFHAASRGRQRVNPRTQRLLRANLLFSLSYDRSIGDRFVLQREAAHSPRIGSLAFLRSRRRRLLVVRQSARARIAFIARPASVRRASSAAERMGGVGAIGETGERDQPHDDVAGVEIGFEWREFVR